MAPCAIICKQWIEQKDVQNAFESLEFPDYPKYYWIRIIASESGRGHQAKVDGGGEGHQFKADKVLCNVRLLID